MSRKMNQKILSRHTRISKKYKKKEKQKRHIYSQKHVRLRLARTAKYSVLEPGAAHKAALISNSKANKKTFTNKKQSNKKYPSIHPYFMKRRAESPLILTQHGMERMAERNISLKELQMTKMHGKIRRSQTKGGKARWKVQYENIVYMTNKTQNTVITAYKLSSSWENESQQENRRKISAKKQLNKEAIHNQMLLNII